MAGVKSILVISLVVSMLVVPSTASLFGLVKCVALCFLKFGGNPFSTIPCLLECKKEFPLAVDVNGRVDDHSLCTTGCALSKCFTTPVRTSDDTQEQGQGLSEEELMKNCVIGCDYSCKARKSNKVNKLG